MKNIYCIVGPSGCGKTTLVEALEVKYGFKVIQSYTTRPPRFETETGHIFVSPEEFKSLGEMCAYTKFDGYEYGVTADLIEINDLYVIDPAGVEFLREKYDGAKGVKVIGINADIDVLVERMQLRGDSEEKIIQRLANDAEKFKHFDSVCNIVLRSDFNSVVELCEAVKWHIDNYEYWVKHEFSLLNERGEPVVEGKRFYTREDAWDSLSKAYPNGLPKGWNLRDDTELLREKFIQEIHKLRPSFKTSMIKINMENSGTSRDGYTVVSFSYKGKNYFYRNYWNDEPWIQEDVHVLPERSAENSLRYKLDLFYKRIDKLENELTDEYEDGETVWASQLEIEKDRLEKTVCFIESALDLIRQEKVLTDSCFKSDVKTKKLDDVISSCEKLNKGELKQNFLDNSKNSVR